ncbi:MAG: AMP-binding protein [Planctomycetota bacterium]
MSTTSHTEGFFSDDPAGDRPVYRSDRRPDLLEIYPKSVPRYLEYPNTSAAGLLAQTCHTFPNRIATEFLGHTSTYGAIEHAVNSLASWLQSREIHSGERVGILLPNCPEYLIALNAVWRAGGVAVSISPLSVASDVERLLSLTKCRTVIALDMFSDLLSTSEIDHHLLVSLFEYIPRWKQAVYTGVRWKRTGNLHFPCQSNQTWMWDAVATASGNLSPVEILPDKDPAYILSTGGTTGDPKAVTLSHKNILANAWQQKHWVGSGSNDEQETMLAVLPFFHSYGMSTMLATGAALGAKLVMQPRFSPGRALQAIERHKPTIFHAVPAMLAAMNQKLRRRRSDLSSLKWVISGGASLPQETASEFTNYSRALVVEGYGLSEASPVTHVGPLDGRNQTGTIGLPLPDTNCRVVDIEDPKKDLLPGEVGELLVKGPQVMLGYWNNAQATQQVLREGWLHTGDLARVNERGFYEIVDRKKDLIITSGFNVYPADVEQVLRECPDIADVAVVGVRDASRGEIVKACVVLNKGVRWNQARLDKFCQSRLAKHRRPLIWEHIADDLPRNFLGKVIRRELRA